MSLNQNEQFAESAKEAKEERTLNLINQLHVERPHTCTLEDKGMCEDYSRIAELVTEFARADEKTGI